MHEQHLLIPGPAGQLQLQLALPDNWDAQGLYVVCCHPHPLHGGTLQNKVVHTVAKTFYEQGIAALRFNFRGVGQSTGEFDHGRGELADLLAVSNWFARQYPARRGGVAGFSFGAGVALTAQPVLRPDWMLLVAPAVHLFDAAALRVSGTSACLVIQGQDDEVVSAGAIQTWLAQQTQAPPIIWLDGVGHFFHGKLAVLRETIIPFIEQLKSS